MKSQLNFQVDTEGSVEIKTLLRDLFIKHVSKGKTDGMYDADKNFIGKDAVSFYARRLIFSSNGIEHNELPWRSLVIPEVSIPEVSIPEAIKLITGYKAFEPVEVKLNGEYTALVQQDGSVKVGCQTFSREAIVNLYHAVTSVK